MSLFVVHINQKKGPSSSGSITYGELLVDWALSIGKVSYVANVFYVSLTLQEITWPVVKLRVNTKVIITAQEPGLHMCASEGLGPYHK